MKTTLALLLCVGGVSAHAQFPGTFTVTGNMTTPRAGHRATLLLDGRVLIAGGENYPSALATAELYDPAMGTFNATGSMTTARVGHTATLLPDGRVLIAGGSTTSAAELYNPSTETFSATGEMVDAHLSGFTATLLTNEKVLITGGLAGSRIASPELYDPSTGTFSLAGPYAGSYPTDDFGSMATLLSDGAVLFNADPVYSPSYGAEIYHPESNVFTPTGAMVTNINARTATLLPNGKVLLAGGADEDARYKQSELYDPSAGTFTATGNMTARREYQQATLLNDGRVLVTGGLFYAGIGLFNGSVSSAELYNPPVLTPAPAVFSLLGNGKGQGAIWHADTGQLASPSSPTVAGEVLSMYTTSLIHGGVIPPQDAVGGRLGTILYFGGAPGYPGYYQVNFRVPDGVAPGPAIPVRLNYLGCSSNEVTLSVR